jgi:hypothetical protein
MIHAHFILNGDGRDGGKSLGSAFSEETSGCIPENRSLSGIFWGNINSDWNVPANPVLSIHAVIVFE